MAETYYKRIVFAEWIDEGLDTVEPWTRIYHCSECGCKESVSTELGFKPSKWCSGCGAWMDEYDLPPGAFEAPEIDRDEEESE